MGDRSQEGQALMKIQHEWAEARVKGESSYTRLLEAEDCTIVWPDGRIVNKRGDLESMTGNIVFSEFKVHNLQVRLYDDTGIVVGGGHHQSAQGNARSPRRKIRLDRHICETGRSMKDGSFANHSGLGKVIAHSY
jgi:hypothetical protein